MRKVFYVFVMLFILSTFAHAQWGYNYQGKIKTGKLPLRVYLTNVGFVLYCAGYDANFDGKKDAGDEAPSLWFIGQDLDNNFYSKKLIDLDFRTPLIPSRSYFDLQRNVFYSINTNSIDTVSLYFDGTEPAAKKARFLSDIFNVTSISGSTDSKLFFSVRESLDKGFIYIYDLNKSKFIDTIKAGVGVQMNEYMFYIDELFVLNEGTFGKDDGSLQRIEFKDGKPDDIKTYKIGGLPNHFMFDLHFQKVYLTCNTTNNIIRMDAFNKIDTIHFDLPKYNGPRETTIFPIPDNPNPLFAVTTYDGKVFIVNDKKEILHTFDAYGKAESLWFIGDAFLIITPYEAGSYNPLSEITLYSTKTTDVSEQMDGDWFVYPNPVRDRFAISYPEGAVIQSAALFNAMGKKLDSFNKSEIDNIHISNSLPAGVYFINVKSDKGIKIIPFVVTK